MKKAILCICLSVFLVTPVFAKKGGGMLPPGKWWHMPKVVESLKITSAEQTFLDKLFLEKRKAIIAIKGEMATHRLDFETIMEKEPFDKGAAMDQFERTQEVGKKMWESRVKFLIEVRELLGKDRFMQLKTQFKQFHGKRHRKGKGQRHWKHGKGSDFDDRTFE